MPPRSNPDHSGTSRTPLLTASEVAAILNISERTVRRMTADGRLAIVRIGRSVRIRPEVLTTLIGEE
jgi:excisionase family DNA binding protein